MKSPNEQNKANIMFKSHIISYHARQECICEKLFSIMYSFFSQAEISKHVKTNGFGKVSDPDTDK